VTKAEQIDLGQEWSECCRLVEWNWRINRNYFTALRYCQRNQREFRGNWQSKWFISTDHRLTMQMTEKCETNCASVKIRQSLTAFQQVSVYTLLPFHYFNLHSAIFCHRHIFNCCHFFSHSFNRVANMDTKYGSYVVIVEIPLNLVLGARSLS